jgi:hypothetical protein
MEGRFTPTLRACPRAPTAMTQNTDVGNNLTNGTQGKCIGAHLKPGHAVHCKKVNGHNVKCVRESEVEHVQKDCESVSQTLQDFNCKISIA